MKARKSDVNYLLPWRPFSQIQCGTIIYTRSRNAWCWYNNSKMKPGILVQQQRGIYTRSCGVGAKLEESFRTAVSVWGQSTQISSSLSPNRDCGSKRVKYAICTRSCSSALRGACALLVSSYGSAFRELTMLCHRSSRACSPPALSP